MTQPKSESATSAAKSTLSLASLRAMSPPARPLRAPSAGEVPPPLLEVRVLVEGGAGRREQHRVAGPGELRGPRAPPSPSCPPARAVTAPARARSIVPAASPIVRTTARRARQTSAAGAGKSPCLSRPPRISRTRPSRYPSRDFAVASTLVPFESLTQRTPALRHELACGAAAPEVRAGPPAIAASGSAEAVRRGDGGEGVLQVVRARQRDLSRPRSRPVRSPAASEQDPSPLDPYAPRGRCRRREKGTRRAASRDPRCDRHRPR